MLNPVKTHSAGHKANTAIMIVQQTNVTLIEKRYTLQIAFFKSDPHSNHYAGAIEHTKKTGNEI